MRPLCAVLVVLLGSPARVVLADEPDHGATSAPAESPDAARGRPGTPPPPTTSPPSGTPPPGTPPPATTFPAAPAAPAAPLPPAPAAPLPPALRPRGPERWIGLGGGAWYLTADPSANGLPDQPEDLGTVFVPTVVIEARNTRPFGEGVAAYSDVQIVMQDFAAMADYYRWYGKGDEDTVAQKALVLWPGLIFGWIAGSHIASTYGVTVSTRPQAPSLYLDIGTQLTLFVRPSGDDFQVDLGVGLASSVGYQLAPRQAVQLSVGYSWPLFHGGFEQDGRRSLLASLGWMYRL